MTLKIIMVTIVGRVTVQYWVTMEDGMCRNGSVNSYVASAWCRSGHCTRGYTILAGDDTRI